MQYSGDFQARGGFRRFLLLLTYIVPFSAVAIGAATRQPTIVLVPGAWHSPIHYTELMGLLRARNYEVFTQRNPSCDSSNPNAQSVSADAASIRANLLMPQINAGKDVVLVMHSYGGCPGAAAAKGLSKADLTAKGKEGGIIGLLFICAFLAKEGDSLLSKLPGRVFDPWVIQYDGTGQLGVRDPKEVFYADVPSPVDRIAIGAIRNQSRNALSTPSGPPAWLDAAYTGRRGYFRTLLDNSIPSFAQQMMLDSSGVGWSIKSFPSSHSPFLSHPKVLGAWMIEQIRSFVEPGITATVSRRAH